MRAIDFKDIIYASVEVAFWGSYQHQKIGPLIQQAIDKLTTTAASLSCNGVININFNIANDSEGTRGGLKNIFILATGTPPMVVI